MGGHLGNSDMGWWSGIPEDIDWRKPSPARVYDVHLGGSHNFAVDREVAARVAAVMPELPDLLRANRSFLRRAVLHLVRAGVRQFLDLGSGIPTVGNVHEVALSADPSCRIVYVDNDPVAVAHSKSLLRDTPNAGAVLGDLRDYQGGRAVLGRAHPEPHRATSHRLHRRPRLDTGVLPWYESRPGHR